MAVSDARASSLLAARPSRIAPGAAQEVFMRRSLQLAACSVLLGFMVAAPASAQVRRDPRQAWVFDDAVDESRREGNRLFVGGSFRTASPQVNGSRGFAELTVNSATPTRPFPRLS